MTFAFLLIAAPVVQAAGLKKIEVPADHTGQAITATQWAPCARPAKDIQAGPFVISGVRDCPVAGKNLPLILISHGFGGASLSHHDTAEALSDAGFIVVALNHPDDTLSNTERFHNRQALLTRATDVKRLLDYMLTSSPDSAIINPNSIGFFGFSRGGYTGLILAGAQPDFKKLHIPCENEASATCGDANTQKIPLLPPSRDPRIKAFVLADPLSTVFADPTSLKHITAPIDLWGSQHGGDGVSATDILTLAQNLPVSPTLHIVPNAGHFSFLTLCPPPLAERAPALCKDSPNFDRAAFHQKFNANIISFFRKNLAIAPQP
ncbi:alpha/beta hydrolase family protein [Terasakiella pusilla]|uniref:alpha/beta hydrolase family protein n=1 Tax=Terasakiella pusilla TaxID=64973 RepID=UPI001969CFF7|nr:hypothetical protein [Terasakiella pusilla]